MLKIGDRIIIQPLSPQDIIGSVYEGEIGTVIKVNDMQVLIEFIDRNGDATQIGGTPSMYADIVPIPQE